jgi:hypothetical protein
VTAPRSCCPLRREVQNRCIVPPGSAACIIGAADFTVDVGGLAFGGIGVGCICAVVLLPLGELAYKAINGDRPPPSSTRTPGH